MQLLYGFCPEASNVAGVCERMGLLMNSFFHRIAALLMGQGMRRFLPANPGEVKNKFFFVFGVIAAWKFLGTGCEHASLSFFGGVPARPCVLFP